MLIPDNWPHIRNYSINSKWPIVPYRVLTKKKLLYSTSWIHHSMHFTANTMLLPLALRIKAFEFSPQCEGKILRRNTISFANFVNLCCTVSTRHLNLSHGNMPPLPLLLLINRSRNSKCEAVTKLNTVSDRAMCCNRTLTKFVCFLFRLMINT